MKLNLSKPLLDLRGQAIEGVNLAEVTANMLASGRSDSPARTMHLAMRLVSAQGEIDIEEPDLALIESQMKTSKLNDLAMYRIQTAIAESRKA